MNPATKNPVISFIVPVLNEKSYLPEFFHSLFSQSFEEAYEVIVAGCVSSDGSLTVVHHWDVRVLSYPRGLFN